MQRLSCLAPGLEGGRLQGCAHVLALTHCTAAEQRQNGEEGGRWERKWKTVLRGLCVHCMRPMANISPWTSACLRGQTLSVESPLYWWLHWVVVLGHSRPLKPRFRKRILGFWRHWCCCLCERLLDECVGLAHGIVGTKQRQMEKGWNNFELL